VNSVVFVSGAERKVKSLGDEKELNLFNQTNNSVVLFVL
jgi:hypothetical protein